MKADRSTIRELEELLSGLKVVRDHLSRQRFEEAQSLLETVGNRLVDLIEDCRRHERRSSNLP